MSSSSRARARVPIAEIPVRFKADGSEAVGHLENLTRTGVFVRTDDLPRDGAAVALQFHSPSGILIDLRGEVRWNSEGLSHLLSVRGFGVLLHEPPPEYLEFFDWAFRESADEKPADPESV
jgi:hypothetical protein